jgi:2-polyprenyl-3-methyl-5-hydroxy-6-metoxy-1,4-benzoquinol methylase
MSSATQLMKSKNHWSKITKDPNSLEALDFIQSCLKRARSEPIPNRVAYLVELVRGKDVLDIGVVDHFAESRSKKDWLHHRVAQSAASVLGLDILPQEVARLNAAGYRVLLMDFSEQVPAGCFDIVLCGEVIEHVPSPQKLFRSAREVLRPGGRFVLTTPNPYFMRRIVNALRGKTTESVDHIALLAPANIAEMAMREGLVLTSWRGVMDPGSASSMRARVSALLRPAWLRVFPPEIFCETIVYECTQYQSDRPIECAD